MGTVFVGMITMGAQDSICNFLDVFFTAIWRFPSNLDTTSALPLPILWQHELIINSVHEKFQFAFIAFLVFRVLRPKGHFALSAQLRAIDRNSVSISSRVIQGKDSTHSVEPGFHGSQENAKHGTIQLFLTSSRIDLLGCLQIFTCSFALLRLWK